MIPKSAAGSLRDNPLATKVLYQIRSGSARRRRRMLEARVWNLVATDGDYRLKTLRERFYVTSAEARRLVDKAFRDGALEAGEINR